jgi:hypothetical protein
MLEVPSALRQGSAHVLINVKLTVLSDVGDAIRSEIGISP